MTTPTLMPSLYDTYNAKWLSPADVAKTFVPPPQFARLAKRRNTLIVGPRGSGKTTLLKMLTQPALDQWSGEGAAQLRQKIGYTGVFIATDVSWNFQIRSLADDSLNPKSLKLLQTAALTAHTHKAIVEAMESRAASLRERYDNSAVATAREASLVLELARVWKLTPTVPSYFSLKCALRERLQRVHELAIIERELDISTSPARLIQNDFVVLPFLVSCRNATETFNDIYKEKRRFWALLFDEVELMPTNIREELYQYLRTFPGQLLFKLALSPFDDDLPSETSQNPPQRDNDYDFIPLWYPKKRKGYSFCRALWNGIISDSPMTGKRPEEVLGKSLVDTETDDWSEQGTAYSLNSPHYDYLTELASIDESFRDYLKGHNIELRNIDSIRGSERASTLRKVFPLVVARVERLRTNRDNSPELRSRKVSTIYTGTTAIFDICEGNPRTFIGLVSRLLEHTDQNRRRIGGDVQADEITQAVDRFRALLRTIVIPNLAASRFKKGMLSFLDPIGRQLQRLSLVESFTPEPPGTFVVDPETDSEMSRLLGYALNVGAIMHVPDREGDEELLSSSRLRTKKFRLSYLLAAHYGIPPRLGRHISLLSLLRKVSTHETDGLFSPGVKT